MEPFSSVEEFYQLILKCPGNINCVKTFFEIFRKELEKFPNQRFKEVINPLVENKMIFFGYPAERINYSTSVGEIGIAPDLKRIVSIVFNANSHGIDSSGNPEKKEALPISAYHIFINSGLSLYHDPGLTKDQKVIDLLTDYYYQLLAKTLRFADLYKEKQDIAKFLTIYFLNRFIFNFSSGTAMEKGFKFVGNPNLETYIDTVLLTKYKSSQEYANALFDFKVIPTNPNNIRNILIGNLGVHGYLAINRSIFKLFASAIAAKYRHFMFEKMLINIGLISELEKHFLDVYLGDYIVDPTPLLRYVDPEKEFDPEKLDLGRKGIEDGIELRKLRKTISKG